MDKIYIAGPMRGIKHYNFPAFDKKEKYLIALYDGYVIVFNPAQMDRDVGFDAMTLPDDYDWNKIPDGFNFQSCVDRDINAIKQCNRIWLLDGWEKSSGARAEKALAEWLGLTVHYDTLPDESKEERITNPTTGGQKGRKTARYELIPIKPMLEVAELYGEGSKKYGDRNWEKGYDWSLSYGALQRHANQFWGGEDYDTETKKCHLASVVFHALALMEFMATHPELDDRRKAR